MASLFTSLSGLQAHQQWIDVLGDNLANSNTPGFKTSRATFADHFSRTLQFASGPGVGTGGRNPVQLGNGVRLADIGRSFAQGSLTNSGRTFDLALQGRGFFAVDSGSGNLFTRVGTFGLDALKNLVDVRSGFRVLGPTGQPISVDTDSPSAPQATGSMQFKGNLPAVVSGPLREVLTGQTALTEGTNATIVAANAGPYAIPTGETWTMGIQVDGNTAQTVSVTSTTGSVLASDIAAAIDALDGVSASVNGGGLIEIVSDRKGTQSSLKINPGAAGRDLASLTGASTVLTAGTESAVTGTTTLNNLPGNVVPYVPGDSIQISGVDNDGTAINATFVYGAGNDGETVDDFVAFLDGLYGEATVTLEPDGRIRVEADTAGDSGLSLSILDGDTNTGETTWSTYALSVTTEGTGPDELQSSMEVYDRAGVAHTLSFTFQRQEDLSWNVIPSIDPDDGTLQTGTITGLTFNPDGSPSGLGNLDLDVGVTFTGQPPQTVALNLGRDGQLDGVTQFGSAGNVFVFNQDGHAVGELSNISVNAEGIIEGFYTNGQVENLGAVGVAVFGNPEGLRHAGDNLFAQTTNSGALILGAGATGPAGSVVGGSLENSNVDTAEQFVYLIEAQRGFQANARVITTQDELLAEMVNLI